jgi:hypothetical protein
MAASSTPTERRSAPVSPQRGSSRRAGRRASGRRSSRKGGIAIGGLIERIDGDHVTDARALATILARHHSREKIAVAGLRPDGTTAAVTVTLGQLRGG